jgi:uncharacterized protein (TIGR03000 family)
MPSYSYSCNGYQQPMMPGFDGGGYAQPVPTTSYYYESTPAGCYGTPSMPLSTGPAPFNFPSASPDYAVPSATPPNTINEDPRFRPAISNNDAMRGTVIVRLPENATLYAEGRRLNLTGESRRFVTPPLPSMAEYSYTFRVEYTRNGETISRSKQVNVKAGTTTNVEFDDGLGRAAPLTPQQMPLTGRPVMNSLPTVPAPETKPASLPTIAPPKADAPERAKITVKLLPGSVLFVDGKRNDRSETVREFTTPPLPHGQEFAYMMRAEIMRNGQPESQSMKVTFRAGEIQTVDLSAWPNFERASR